MARKLEIDRKLDLAGIIAILLLVSGLFAWEYGQTGDIRENSNDIENTDKNIDRLRDDIKQVDKKVDEIKTILIKKR